MFGATDGIHFAFGASAVYDCAAHGAPGGTYVLRNAIDCVQMLWDHYKESIRWRILYLSWTRKGDAGHTVLLQDIPGTTSGTIVGRIHDVRPVHMHPCRHTRRLEDLCLPCFVSACSCKQLGSSDLNANVAWDLAGCVRSAGTM